MYCKYCGQIISDDSVFCEFCGKDITKNKDSLTGIINPTKSNESDIIQSPKRHIMKTIIVVSLLLVIGIIYGSYRIFKKPTIADNSIDTVSTELAEACKRYDRIYSFSNGLASVELNGKYGFIDKLGKEIISCKYDDASSFECGYATVQQGDKHGVIDRYGNIILPIVYDYININSDTTFSVSKDDRMSLIDVQGKTLIPFEYASVDGISEGLVIVRDLNNRIGFADKSSGALVIQCIYDELYNGIGFVNGLCGVKQDNKWGYIDKSGEIVIPFDKHNTGQPFENDLSTRTRYSVDENGYIIPGTFQMAFINKSGDIVSEWFNADLKGFRDGYCVVQDSNNRCGLIDIHGNWIIPCKYWLIANGFEKNGLIKVSYGPGQVGFFDLRKRQEVIPCVYDTDEMSFSDDGLLAIKDNSRWGYIDQNATIIIPAIYDEAYSFSDGFGVVVRYGRYGFVDRYGKDTFN